jgi:hypothetical protein
MICFTICLCISPDLDGNRGTTKMCPERQTKGSETQIRSHSTAGSSNHRLPNSTTGSMDISQNGQGFFFFCASAGRNKESNDKILAEGKERILQEGNGERESVSAEPDASKCDS